MYCEHNRNMAANLEEVVDLISYEYHSKASLSALQHNCQNCWNIQLVCTADVLVVRVHNLLLEKLISIDDSGKPIDFRWSGKSLWSDPAI